MKDKNKVLEEIKDYIKDTQGSGAIEYVLEELTKNISEIFNDLSLDEFGVEYDDDCIMGLDQYTEAVYENAVRLFCNVLDSYKEK